MFASDGVAHEDDEEGNGDGKNLSDEEVADAGRRGRKRQGAGWTPIEGKEDDDEMGKHPEEISPAWGNAGIDDGEEVFDIGENESEEDGGQGAGKGAQPGREGGAGAEEESEGEDEVAGDVDEEDFTEDGGLIGSPTSGGIEEIEVEGDGDDGDLEEVEKAEGVDSGGVLVRARKKDHEDGSGPDEKENIGGPGRMRGAGNKTLVIGADGLSERFEGKSDGEERPDLAGVAGRASRREERAGGGEQGHGEVEGIGNKEIGEGGAIKFDVEEQEQREEERRGKKETRKLAGWEQDDPTVEQCWDGESVQRKGDIGYRRIDIRYQRGR